MIYLAANHSSVWKYQENRASDTGATRMLSYPQIGQRVQVWYADKTMPLQGMIGVVKIRSVGRPRNHGVLIDGKIYSIPCGNLRKVQDG